MSAANGETLVIVINRLLLRLDARGVSANEIVACIKPLIAESEAKALSSLAMVTAESADRNISLRLERYQLRKELALLREWQREVIQNANAHHAERKEAIARAERAEAELATERARLKEMAAELAHCAGYIASVRTDRLITWHEELYALQTLEWAEGAFEIAEKANAVLEAHDAAMKEDAK